MKIIHIILYTVFVCLVLLTFIINKSEESTFVVNSIHSTSDQIKPKQSTGIKEELLSSLKNVEQSEKVADLKKTEKVKICPITNNTFLQSDFTKNISWYCQPVCKTSKIMYVPVGGLGNQINLFTFLYFLSTVEKIPLYIPEHNVFATHFKIYEFFDNQINTYPWEDYLKELPRCVQRGGKPRGYFNENSFRAMRRDQSFISKRNVCNTFFNVTLWISGYEIVPDLIYEDPAFNATLTELNLFRPHIYDYEIPTHPWRYEYFLFTEFMKPIKAVTDYMKEMFPNYTNIDYLSVHVRFGKSASDFKDTQVRMNYNKMDGRIRDISERMKRNNLSIAYVASDSSRFKELIKSKLREKVVVLEFGRIYHTDAILNPDISTYFEANKKALTEIYLLANGKDCLGSQSSSFSWLGCSGVNATATML